MNDIVEVNGVPILIKGGDRDVTVKLAELEYCITAIRKMQDHKALLMLEKMASRVPVNEELL